MQVMVIEWARNVLGWKDADSAEFNRETPKAVISPLADQVDIKVYGASMRLGAYKSVLSENTLVARAYGTTAIEERHRHRYEFTNRYREDFAKSGLVIAGTTEDGSLVEAVEWPDTDGWGVGVQFHPEFKSKPTAAHPLFRAFLAAARDRTVGV
jgi:CTP synthase